MTDPFVPPPPIACPYCEQHTGLKILYGLPYPEVERAASQGKLALGGCMVSPEAPTRVCTSCRYRWTE